MKKFIVALLFALLFIADGEAAGRKIVINGREVDMNQMIVDPKAALPPASSVQLERVEEIWQQLAAATGFDAMVMYNDEDTMNAYITRDKNGYYWVVIYRGLLKILRTEDQVAGVFAHEIGHGVNEHLDKARNSTIGILVGANILGAILGRGKWGEVAEVAIGIGASLAVNGYSREHEVEADDYGVQYSARAGFNPWGLYDSIRLMADAGLVTPPSGFNSHPPTERRMSRLRSQAERWENELSAKHEPPAQNQKETTPAAPAPSVNSDKADVINSYPVDAGEKNVLTMLHNNSVKQYDAGRYKEALAGFTRAAESYDKHYLAALWAARSAQKLGDKAKMKKWIEISLSVNPNYEPAKEFKAKYF